MSDKAKIIYTITDEAPALATYSLLPIIEAYTSAAGIDVETRDISLANRILAGISELLPEKEGGYRFSNSDPITGQAAWYDLRVRLEKSEPGDELSQPQFATQPATNKASVGERILRYGARFKPKRPTDGKPGDGGDNT